MKCKQYRGFTLIELLVVIAIIGVLSAVVLASLNSARSKGNDAGVKANLNTVGTQAALYLSDNSNSYGTFNNGTANTPGSCPTTAGTGSVFLDGTIVKAIASALVDAGAGGATLCVASGSTYAAAVSRPETVNSTYWCVDSAGSHCGVSSLTAPSCSCIPGGL